MCLNETKARHVDGAIAADFKGCCNDSALVCLFPAFYVSHLSHLTLFVIAIISVIVSISTVSILIVSLVFWSFLLKME